MTRVIETPVVFLGPSCPADDVRAVLPGAMIVPPASRGDLYRYRLLNFGLFVLIDGVFSDALAVSPREVVDVLQDGAAVVGASSMGALRAVDCAPAGAIGRGTVYRLFRRGSLRSEDEVAVLHLPGRAWPPVTLALVSIRVAARRARRAGHFGRTEERALVEAAEALGYDKRTWRNVFKAAGLDLPQQTRAALHASDIKRDDAIHCCRWVSLGMASGRLRSLPRAGFAAPLGRLGQQRERGPDPGDGQQATRLAPEFLDWLWCSGRLADLADLREALEREDIALLSSHVGLNEPDPDLAALILSFIGFRRAVRAARHLKLVPDASDEARTLEEILQAHHAHSATELAARLADVPRLHSRLTAYRRDRALCLHLRNSILFQRSDAPRRPCLRWHRARSRMS